MAKEKGEALQKAAEKKELKITAAEIKKKLKASSNEVREEALDAYAEMMEALADKDQIERERAAARTKYSDRAEKASDLIDACRARIMAILYPPPIMAAIDKSKADAEKDKVKVGGKSGKGVEVSGNKTLPPPPKKQPAKK